MKTAFLIVALIAAVAVPCYALTPQHRVLLAGGNKSGPAPPAAGSLLLEDGTSFLLLEDGASHLCLEGGC